MTNPTTLQVYVKGTPRPQPRPRFVDGKAISTTSKPAKAYRAVVLAACKSVYAQCGQIKGPVRLDLTLYFKCGKYRDRIGKPHTFRPDWDNCVKLWQDCAKDAHLIEDDSKVSLGSASKLWSEDAGAILLLNALPDGPMAGQDDNDDLGVYDYTCDPINQPENIR